MSENNTYKYLGKPRKIVDGFDKVTGHARYTADLSLRGMVHARPVLSPYAHATITEIDTSEAETMPGVLAVLTAEDLPTYDKTMNSRNSSVLARGKVLFVGQPVAVIVAETAQAAQDAVDFVYVDYEPLPVVSDMDAALDPSAYTIWPHGLPQEGEDLTAAHGDSGPAGEASNDKPNNVLGETRFERGDIEQGFAEADVIVENTYNISVVHQAYLEPHSCVADPDPMGRGLTLYTATQGLYQVRDNVARLLDLPSSQVRVVPMVFGGGFGAKYGILEPLVGAVAMVVDRPVSMVLSRSEDFLTTTPSPAGRITLKTGIKNDGTLTALHAKSYNDNGIYSFQINGIIGGMIGGYYKWPNLLFEGFEVNTHKPQPGAYRAPGSPQATFAMESNMDEMARKLGRDPIDLRLQNVAEEGDLMGHGRPWPPMGLKNCLEALRDHPAWQEGKKNGNEGIGIAIGGWPSFMLPATANCHMDNDGTVNLTLGSVDISGVFSSFVLVAAEIMGVSPDDVRIVQGDTRTGPFGPSSGGSQVFYSLGGAVRKAAENARDKLLQLAGDHFEAAPEDIELAEGEAFVKGVPDKTVKLAQLATKARSMRGGPGPITGEGSASQEQNAPGFVAHLVKIHIDPDTGEIQPLHYTAIQDVGFAVNPLMVQGQMHGGALQGLGFGLYEAMNYDADGQLTTGSFMDYNLPRAESAPTVETVILEVPSPYGPFGARGVGEPPITAGAAAVANAIRDVTGARMTDLPIRPEALWREISG